MFYFYFCLYCSKLSDLGVLLRDGDTKGTKQGDMQTEIFERKIKGLEKENKDLNLRIQGIAFT